MSASPSPPATPARDETGRGLLAGAGGYLLWGFLPLYFPLLEPAGALEVTAHRVVWSLVFCAGLLLVGRSLRAARELLRDRRTVARLTLAAVLLCANWVAFLVGVFTDRVVDAALGYYINPVLTVLLAVVVLRERLRRAQWVAVGIAAAGVAVIAVGYGSFPWIAVTLAVSFGLYGLVKKTVGPTVPALPGLAVETLVLTLPAVGYLVFLTVAGNGTFGTSEGRFGSAAHVLLLVASGVATAVPLLLFATAARRLPLATLGLLQYLTPTMQFLTGVLLNGEQMPPTRWAGFCLVWLALVVLVTDGYRLARQNPAPALP